MNQSMVVERKPPYRTLSSLNCDERRNGFEPSYLILHYTGTKTGQEAEDHYLNSTKADPGGPVAPHFMVDIDGTVTQFVPPEMRAWQAGESRFDGLEDFNSRSIGIEIVNYGHLGRCPEFPPEQMEAVAELCLALMARWEIPAKNVLGHSDIAAGRKIDPGEHFDWEWMAQRGVGLWPKPEPADYTGSAHWLDDDAQLRKAFREAGYDTDPRLRTETLVEAFQRHFQPKKFPDHAGKADEETAARLHCLIRLRHS